MMLLKNLPRVRAETETLPRVLDVGGSSAALNTATHILDLVPPSGRCLEPARDQRPTEFVHHDICRKPWPFPDRFFDFAFCSHTLEDIRDPIGACEELMRVAQRGYIEVPSRVREIFYHKRFPWLRAMFGRPLRIGFGHHRWFCEMEDTGLVFMAKTSTALQSAFVIGREELGRDLSPEDGAIGFFWDGSFTVRERILIEPGEIEADLAAFKQRVVRDTSSRGTANG